MKTLKALFGMFVVVGGFYVAFKLIPPYFNNYQFEDAIESEARLNAYSNKSEQQIREAVAKKALEFDIPLTAEKINVQRLSGEIAIWAEYTVHVDLPGFPLDLKFRPATRNKAMGGARMSQRVHPAGPRQQLFSREAAARAWM